jgi:hypothetical protein
MRNYLSYRRAIITLLVLFAIILGWRQYTLHWITERHEVLVWALHLPDELGKAQGVSGIGMQPPDHLPVSLQIWGETQEMAFIHIDLNELPKDDLPRVNRLKSLFPEADVRISQPATESSEAI